MSKQHFYEVNINWIGNLGVGTKDYTAYSRNHTISVDNKVDILASADTAFKGDATKYNPEELLVASISACHMLWYLHLCADAGIVVTNYTDNPKGIMVETVDIGGHFTALTLFPVVTITDILQKEKAIELHNLAHRKCFIANSCNFPIHHQVTIIG